MNNYHFKTKEIKKIKDDVLLGDIIIMDNWDIKIIKSSKYKDQ